MDSAKSPPGSILKQINALFSMSMKDLKGVYQKLSPQENAPSNKTFLIRRIAYRLQEDAFGGLSSQAKGRLEVLKTELNPLKDLGAKRSREGEGKVVRRLPLPGTVITKTYKGQPVEVKVLHKGFEYGGKPYRSLSRVAKEVTGVHQSGFVFFGL
jgi:hypothetical protein